MSSPALTQADLILHRFFEKLRTTSLPGGGPMLSLFLRLSKAEHVSVFFFKIQVRLNPILPRFHAPNTGSLFQFSAYSRQTGHDAHSCSARRGAPRPTGPAYHRGLVLFLYNRPPGGFFQKIWPGGIPSGPSVRKSAAVNCSKPPAPPRGCGPDRPPPGSGR